MRSADAKMILLMQFTIKIRKDLVLYKSRFLTLLLFSVGVLLILANTN